MDPVAAIAQQLQAAQGFAAPGQVSALQAPFPAQALPPLQNPAAVQGLAGAQALAGAPGLPAPHLPGAPTMPGAQGLAALQQLAQNVAALQQLQEMRAAVSRMAAAEPAALSAAGAASQLLAPPAAPPAALAGIAGLAAAASAGAAPPQPLTPATPAASSSAPASASPGSPRHAAPRAAPEAAAEEPQEVPRCHLHKKVNKACKFCKAHAGFVEQKNREAEEKKTAALERMKGARSGKPGDLGPEDQVPLPNFSQFPAVLKERILSNRLYNQALASAGFDEVKDQLFGAKSCEPEVRGASSSLDTVPSPFFCGVYRLLSIKLTDSELRSLLNSRSRWVRCAAFVYVRLGVHQDRYWDLLSEFLIENEDFVPCPESGGERMSEGKFVEDLLTKEKYCDISLPRIAAAQRRLINERLVLYDQFRRRYGANLEVLDRFEKTDGGIQVEVCSVDGEWAAGETTGLPSPGRRRVTVPVRRASGERENVSLGMVICPPSRGSSASTSDLTRSRGRCYQELLEKYRERERESAVASGKDYCKSSGRHTVHAGGMTFIAGGGGQDQKRKREDEEREQEEARAREAKKSAPSREHEAKMAAIMSKYLAAPGPRGAQGRPEDSQPDRMRLG